jgi:hypothetical protein
MKKINVALSNENFTFEITVLLCEKCGHVRIFDGAEFKLGPFRLRTTVADLVTVSFSCCINIFLPG